MIIIWIEVLSLWTPINRDKALLIALEALQKEDYYLRAVNSQLKTHCEIQRASLAEFQGIPLSLVLQGLLCRKSGIEFES